MSGLRDGTRIVVTGNPTPEELAAALVAVHRARDDATAPAAKPPAWQVAARLEGAGHRPLSSPWELPPA